MKKYISLCSILLFVIPIVTLLICLQIHVLYYDLQSIPFIDGKVSISLIGRQEKTIAIFKSGLRLQLIVNRNYIKIQRLHKIRQTSVLQFIRW